MSGDAPQRKYIDWPLLVGIALIIALPVGACVWGVTAFVIPYLNRTPFPHVVGQNCGEVYNGAMYAQMSLEHLNAVDPHNSEECLQRAYAACQTATLIFNSSNGLASTAFALVTRCGGGKSVVSVSSEFFGDSGPPPPFSDYSVATVQCAGMSQGIDLSNEYYEVNGLIISHCKSGGNEFFPARPASQKGNVCGTLRNERGALTSLSVSGIPPDPPYAMVQPRNDPTVGQCFWQAYTTCAAPATLVYIVATGANNVTTSTEHTLVAQPINGACSLTDATYMETLMPVTSGAYDEATDKTGPTYTCASLTRDPATGYLTAHHCGAEGDVVIAPSSPSATTTPTATP